MGLRACGVQDARSSRSSITGTSATTARSTATPPSRSRSSHQDPGPVNTLPARRLPHRACANSRRAWRITPIPAAIPKTLSLEDKEYILANGTDADATGLWALLKGQLTPVPGIVISDPATVLKITVTTAASVKPKDFVVKLTNPVACSAVPPPPTELKIADAQAYILANGVKADTDAMGDVLTDTPAHIHKIAIEPSVSTINVAVTQDAKDAHTADFTVNLKDPLSCKDAPACRLRAGPAAGHRVGRHLRHLHAYCGGWNHCRFRANRAQRRIHAAGEEGGPVHHTAPKPSPAHHAQ